MKFLKDNWFKVGVLTLLFALCISLLYTYSSYMNSKSDSESNITAPTATTTSNAPSQQTIIYTNPAKEANQVRLGACIDAAENDYNRIVLDLSEKVRNGELDKSFFGPSVDALEKRKVEQKADCEAKYN